MRYYSTTVSLNRVPQAAPGRPRRNGDPRPRQVRPTGSENRLSGRWRRRNAAVAALGGAGALLLLVIARRMPVIAVLLTLVIIAISAVQRSSAATEA